MQPKKQLVYRKEDLKPATGIGPGTCARLERRGEFPKRRQLADGSVGWLVREVEAWCESRPVVEPGTTGLRGEKRGEHKRETAT